MRLLVVTGRRAEKTVRESIDGKADVLVLDVNVAAFVSPGLLKGRIEKGAYDLILIPGLAEGDFTSTEKETGAKVRRGPKHAFDLGIVIPFVGSVEFSKDIPACELLTQSMKEQALSLVDELEEEATAPLMLRGVKIGGNSRMKVMAEVVGATLLDEAVLAERIREFEAKGADIIDLGAHLEAESAQLEKALRVARSVTDLPISVDTLDPMLIETGVKGGADLILSLDSRALRGVGKLVADAGVPAVIIPDAGSGLTGLIANIEEARRLGISVIADPVLDPISHGIVESICRYREFREMDEETPLFWGIGNVTELIDADTIGVNAALTGVAMEVEAAILFTPEYSDKAQGSIAELLTASRMMQLARHRESEPKDLGIDLLIIKEKRRRREGEAPMRYTEAKINEDWVMDPLGCFEIWINKGLIVVRHPSATIVGGGAKEILDTIFKKKLVSRLDHAAYLGRELQKAELALKYGRSYAQEDEW